MRTSMQAKYVQHWGINVVPWLWTTEIRILVVIDGRITTGHGENEFGLGFVLDTVREDAAHWVKFDVDVACRDYPESFRFTQDGFDLNTYDQLWLFGDHPDQPDDTIFNPDNSPLTDEELLIIAEWMEDGGGVFATGDHETLGAAMCHRVPRVRTMRRWTLAQGVPGQWDGRLETLQHLPSKPGGPPVWDFDQEGDRWAQPIHPVYRSAGPFRFGRVPHPLLCGRAGVIDRFPDHMHEGVVIDDDDVNLDLALNIPGYAGDEYPFVPPVAPATTAFRPRPHVIAHAMTTNIGSPPVRFGIVGVYDGDPIGSGRVVVDSTWHHWFSYNLVGFQNEVPAQFQAMQDYYRNVALWLATPAQRRAMLFAAIWGALVGSAPGVFDRRMGTYAMADRVVDVIGRTTPKCLFVELVAAAVQQEADISEPNPEQEQAWPPPEVVNRAIVGGIAMELVDLSLDHIRQASLGRQSDIDFDAIMSHAIAGVSAGKRQLIEELDAGAGWIETMRDRLSYDADLSDTAGVRVALRDQVPKATQPGAADGSHK